MKENYFIFQIMERKINKKNSPSSQKINDFGGRMSEHPRIKKITLESGHWMCVRDREMSRSMKSKEKKWCSSQLLAKGLFKLSLYVYI